MKKNTISLMAASFILFLGNTVVESESKKPIFETRPSTMQVKIQIESASKISKADAG